MKQCIENPNEVEWTEFWQEQLKNKEDKGNPKKHK